MSFRRTPGRIYRARDIDGFPLSIEREPTTNDCKPQGNKNNSRYPYRREICVEVDGKRSIGRKELRHPPSSNTRGGEGQIFGRDWTKETNTCDDEIDLIISGRMTCKVKNYLQNG
jgi:hypothetical protein